MLACLCDLILAKFLGFPHQFPKCKFHFIALFRIECWKFWLSSWNAAYDPTVWLVDSNVVLGPTTWWSRIMSFWDKYQLHVHIHKLSTLYKVFTNAFFLPLLLWLFCPSLNFCPHIPWCFSQFLSFFVSRFLLCRKNSKLHISRVRLEDSGNYTCVAENSLGRENATSYVSIQSSKSSIISLFANGWESQETSAPAHHWADFSVCTLYLQQMCFVRCLYCESTRDLSLALVR